MTISRRKLIQSLSATLGIAFIPFKDLIASPVPEDHKVGNSVDFPCKYFLDEKINFLEEVLNLLERGFEQYDYDHNTNSREHAKATIDCSLRQQYAYIKEICENAKDQCIGLWVIVNLTNGESESGARLSKRPKYMKDATVEEALEDIRTINQSLDNHQGYII